MAATAAAAEGRAAYRAVLRAARRTFVGDDLMLKESAVEIRRRFEDNRRLAPGSDETARALADAREAAHFITHMIVQAQRAPSGSFVVKPESVHAGATLEVPSEETVEIEIGEGEAVAVQASKILNRQASNNISLNGLLVLLFTGHLSNLTLSILFV